MSSPQRVSNSEFQAGGIYPGGSGVIKDIGFKLWDYNGNQAPNSQMCVELLFTPTDGSNEGKDVVINWNAASAANHQPDPSNNGFCLDMKGTGAKLADSSNWHFVYDTGFVKNCGMDVTKLDNPTSGLKALIGSELTLVRMEPPKREGLQEAAPAQPGQPARRVNQILVPTRAKWAWEKGAGKSTGKSTPATANPAAANGNGATSGDTSLASFMLQIVTTENGGLDMKDFMPKLTAALTLAGVKGKDRVKLLGSAKDVAQLTAAAQVNNLGLDDLVINADGTMAGSLYTQ